MSNQYRVEVGIDLDTDDELSPSEVAEEIESAMTYFGEVPNGVEVEVMEL